MHHLGEKLFQVETEHQWIELVLQKMKVSLDQEVREMKEILKETSVSVNPMMSTLKNLKGLAYILIRIEIPILKARLHPEIIHQGKEEVQNLLTEAERNQEQLHLNQEETKVI